jgi:hypothetical protein
MNHALDSPAISNSCSSAKNQRVPALYFAQIFSLKKFFEILSQTSCIFDKLGV